jgi:hypothetical protein
MSERKKSETHEMRSTSNVESCDRRVLSFPMGGYGMSAGGLHCAEMSVLGVDLIFRGGAGNGVGHSLQREICYLRSCIPRVAILMGYDHEEDDEKSGNAPNWKAEYGGTRIFKGVNGFAQIHQKFHHAWDGVTYCLKPRRTSKSIWCLRWRQSLPQRFWAFLFWNGQSFLS